MDTHDTASDTARGGSGRGRLRRCGALLAAATVAAVTVGSIAPAGAGAQSYPPLSPCLVQPLYGVNWLRTAETINVAFGTSKPMTSEFRVAPVGTNILNGKVAVDNTPGLGHALKVVDLEPGTSFDYRITTRDAEGRVCNRDGQVTTKKRHVTVTLQTINIQRDGDLAGSGEAEKIHVKIGGQVRAGYYSDIDIDDGDVMHPAFSHTVTNNKTFGIAVQILEDDTECFFSCLPTYGTAPSWTTASTSDYDAATAKRTISVGSLPDASATWTDTMWSEPSPLEFSVGYQVQVTVFD